MLKSKKKSKKEQKEVLIPEELKKSFIKIPGPRKTDKPFSVWFSDIVYNHHIEDNVEFY